MAKTTKVIVAGTPITVPASFGMQDKTPQSAKTKAIFAPTYTPPAPKAPKTKKEIADFQQKLKDAKDQIKTIEAQGLETIKGLQTGVDKVSQSFGSIAANIQFGAGTGAASVAKQAMGEGGIKSVDEAFATIKSITEDPEYVTLVNVFKNYGMGDIADLYLKVKADYPKADKDQVETLLKTDNRYNKDANGNAIGYSKRFAGNVELMKKGKAPLEDAEYLRAESEYEKSLKAYGLNSMATKESYAKLISQEISAEEATKRLQLGYDNLKSNQKVLQAFQTFYPQLSQGDIVAAMLNPDEQLPALQRKVETAQIGGAALRQGLATSQQRAQELQGLGVTQAGAEKGYAAIARYLPTAQKLSEISKETDKFTQLAAEQSQIEGLASAKRREEKLAAEEEARFLKSSGTTQASLKQARTY
jgi:hypothetical protein